MLLLKSHQILKTNRTFSTTHIFCNAMKSNTMPSVSFSLNNPVERAKQYSDILIKNYNRTLPNLDNLIDYYIINFYQLGYHLHRAKYASLDDQFDSVKYSELLKNVNQDLDLRSAIDDMELIKPLIYSQMLQPKTFLLIESSYNFYDPLHKFIENIDPSLLQYNLQYLFTYWLRNKLNNDDAKLKESGVIIDYFHKKIKNKMLSQYEFVDKLGEIDLNLINPESYINFVKLIQSNLVTNSDCKKIMKQTITPTFEIDLFWQAHMLDPIAYDYDCKQNFGFVLEHSDLLPVSNQLRKTRYGTEKSDSESDSDCAATSCCVI